MESLDFGEVFEGSKHTLWGEFNWLPRTATEQMPGRQTGLPAFVEQDAGLQKKQNTGPRPGPQAQRTAAGGSRLAT